MITLAHIAGAFGLKGFVKLKIYTQYLDSLLSYSPLYLVNGDDVVRAQIEAHLIKNDILYVKFSNINDRNEADTLKSFAVCIKPEQLTKLSEHEFYWHDILGFTVINQENKVLGIFDSLFNGSNNEILVIKNAKKDILIPFVPDIFIKKIDTSNKCIIVDWIE
jgi:16S rRNA processing protein RimM